MDEQEAIATRFSGAFLYFIAGSVAATGVNFITGVILSSVRNLDSLLLTMIGLLVLCISYQLTGIAGIYEKYEQIYKYTSLEKLTQAERIAVKRDVELGRRKAIRKSSMPIIVLCITFLLLILGREAFFKELVQYNADRDQEHPPVDMDVGQTEPTNGPTALMRCEEPVHGERRPALSVPCNVGAEEQRHD